ncbi:MAG: discoidin domain-containing protein [Chitinispirillaceae bacterium]|nr:discoidin domain-containing protein [Chitinispirillaceae bacterium]
MKWFSFLVSAFFFFAIAIGTASGQNKTKFLILTTEEAASNCAGINYFHMHKYHQGFESYIVKENAWGGGTGDVAAERIRNYLKGRYAQGFYYVLIIGDPNPVTSKVPMKITYPHPTHQNLPYATDYYYAELTANWDPDGDGKYGEEDDFLSIWRTSGVDVRNCPNMAIGRIPYYGGDNWIDCNAILKKIEDYENATPSYPPWRYSVLLPMDPVDESKTYLCGEQIKDNIFMPLRRFSTFRIYDDEVPVYAEKKPCVEDNVINVWKNSPFGLVTYFAHGLDDRVVDVLSIGRVPELKSAYPSIVFSASCSNAEITGLRPYPIAYALLKEQSVAVVASTNVFLYSNTTNFKYHLSYLFAENVFYNNLELGQALNLAKSKGVDIGATSKCGFTLFGDPSMLFEPKTSSNPSSLIVKQTFGGGGAYLNWADNSQDEWQFDIFVKGPHDQDFYCVKTVGANKTCATVTGLAGDYDDDHEFMVSSWNGSTSLPSSAVSCRIYPIHYPSVPNAATGVVASAVSTSQINLSWKDNATNESAYVLQFSYVNLVDSITIGPNIKSYQHTGLRANTEYRYLMYAKNGDGTSAPSNVAFTTTLTIPKPATPSNLAATVLSREQVKLTWTDNASNEKGFNIERALYGGVFYSVGKVAANIKTYTDNSSLQPGTAYQYRVFSYNDGGNSAYSGVVSATTHSNIARSKTASASSTYSTTYAASKGNDNYTTTRWCASTTAVPQWWKVDLGASKTISGTEVMWQKAGLYKYKIQTSTDNTYWTTRKDLSGNTSTDQTQYQSFSTSARYVRIYISAVPAASRASLYEFRVFGK